MTNHATLFASLIHDFGTIEAATTAFGVGHDGSLLLASASTTEALVENEDWATFPKSLLDAPCDVVIRRWRRGETATIVARTRVVPSFVQPMGDDVLLASARCHRHQTGAEQNAEVIDSSGKLVRQMTLGDGIEHIRTTQRRAVWCGYFDEGVFGNYGWNEPLGACGLVGFDEFGAVTFRYANADAFICDAYAVNVVDDDNVWLVPYTDFPIVQVKGGRYRTWRCGSAGVRALAVDSDRVLLFGGYGGDESVSVVSLRDDGRTRVVRTTSLAFPDGPPAGKLSAVGVGTRLYLFDGGRVFVVDGW